MATGLPERHILSRPHPVFWAGFRSDTVTLQQAGWEFSSDQHFERDSLSLMMRHEAMGIHARTNDVPNMMYEVMVRPERPEFHVQWLTDRSVRWHQVGGFDMPQRVDEYTPVDMKPQMVEVKNLEDMNMFAGCLARTRELIVDPDDVNGMMERILELQDPARQEYYKQRLRENKVEGRRMEAAPRQNFHAQIISLVT